MILETVYVGVGSNQGDRCANIEKALGALRALPGTRVYKTASLYETEPLGRLDQDWFLNTVVALKTSCQPRQLLGALLQIELQLGRVHKERWGPRVIDLDLLLYGDRIINEPDLQVPHPRMAERAFVIVPLAEIAPDLKIPPNKKVGALIPHLTQTQKIYRYCT